MKHANYNVDRLEYKGKPGGVVLEPLDPVFTSPSKIKFGYGYKFNGQEWQDELGLNMTAMDYRQYDNAIGRFNSVDALAEMQYSHTPYHFGYGNPIFWADPTGLLSQNFINSIWDNSASSGWTVWTNSHSGFFSDNHGRGIVDSETGFFTPSVSLNQVEITLYRNNWGGAGALAQSHVYNNSPFYESLRADSRSRNMDSFQSGLDAVGVVDPTGIVDGFNAILYGIRGQKANAAIAALGILPYAGDLAKVGKYGKKTYSVYYGVDASSEAIKYVGITSRNPTVRFAEHLAAGREKASLIFQAQVSGLTKQQARVLEQTLINTHGLEKNGGQLLNKINSIAPSKWAINGITN